MPDLTSLSNVPSDTKPPLIKGEWGGVGDSLASESPVWGRVGRRIYLS
jgi:hypothetical protein